MNRDRIKGDVVHHLKETVSKIDHVLRIIIVGVVEIGIPGPIIAENAVVGAEDVVQVRTSLNIKNVIFRKIGHLLEWRNLVDLTLQN